MKQHLQIAIACAAALMVASVSAEGSGADADGGISMSKKAFVSLPSLPIAPAVQPARTIAPTGLGVDARAARAANPGPRKVFRVELADGSLSRALRRWGKDANYPLLWEAPKDLPSVAASYTGDFLEALEQVMEDSKNAAYPLHACAYDNVVRILHISQSCGR